MSKSLRKTKLYVTDKEDSILMKVLVYYSITVVPTCDHLLMFVKDKQ